MGAGSLRAQGGLAQGGKEGSSGCRGRSHGIRLQVVQAVRGSQGAPLCLAHLPLPRRAAALVGAQHCLWRRASVRPGALQHARQALLQPLEAGAGRGVVQQRHGVRACRQEQRRGQELGRAARVPQLHALIAEGKKQGL